MGDVPDLPALLEILESGSFDGLLGVTEDGRVDFKREPYKLDTEVGKFELAKDVVAFANGFEEALIILGVETEQPVDSPFERAKKVRPMPVALIHEKQYTAVLNARCYPSLRGVTFTTYAPASDDTRCLAVIRIPVQRDEDRPFLVLSPLSDAGQKIQGWLVGLPTRALDETQQMRENEIHELIARGRNVGRRIEEIAVLLARQSDERPPADFPKQPELAVGPSPFAGAVAKVRSEAAARRISDDSDPYGGLVQAPTLFLYARPIDTVGVPTIFAAGGVRERLEDPPMTRHDGWNLATLDRADIVEGTHLRLESGSRKLVEFYEDGSLIAVARFDGHLVASYAGSSDSLAEPPYLKVNSLALVEFIHDFVLAYVSYSSSSSPLRKQWSSESVSAAPRNGRGENCISPRTGLTRWDGRRHMSALRRTSTPTIEAT